MEPEEYFIEQAIAAIKAQNFQELWTEYQNKGEKFTDETFPANDDSIAKKEDFEEQGYEGYNDWRRLADEYGSSGVMFPDELKGKQISPNNIKQGGLGDCYFLSTLAALAAKPERIKKLFSTQKVNSESIYALKMTKNGIPLEIVIDDHVPFKTGSQWPAFTYSTGWDYWVLLAEKAYAKIHGSYGRLRTGWAHDAARDITGAIGYQYYDFDDHAEMWNKLLEVQEKDFFAMCSCREKDPGDDKKFKELGLISSHAYSILRVAEVEDKNGNMRKIIQVRNPWGRFEWHGDYSDSSDSWTDEQREELKVVEQDDGAFWMPYDEFPNFFRTIFIIKYYDDYQLTQKSHKGNWGAHLVQVPTDGNYNFSISQVGDRLFVRDSDYRYSPSRMFLLRIPEGLENMMDSEEKHYICGKTSWGERENHLETDITAGQYLLYTEVDWKETPGEMVDFNYSVTCYSKEPVEFENVTSQTNKFKCVQAAVRAIFLDKSDKITEMNGLDLVNLNSEDVEGEWKEFETDFDYKVFSIENKNSGTLEATLGFNTWKATRVDPLQDEEFTIKVGPENFRLIAYCLRLNQDATCFMQKREVQMIEDCDDHDDHDADYHEHVKEEDYENFQIKVLLEDDFNACIENGECTELAYEGMKQYVYKEEDQMTIVFKNGSESTYLHEEIELYNPHKTNLLLVTKKDQGGVYVWIPAGGQYGIRFVRIDKCKPYEDPIKSQRASYQ